MPKFFITGATGFVGTPLVKELLEHGHEVVGLARSEKSAQKLTGLGASFIRGELQDTDALVQGCEETDGVIHLGFIHEFESYEKSCQIDREVVKILGQTLQNTGKILLYASTFSPIVGEIGIPTDEESPYNELSEDHPDFIRVKTEEFVVSFASQTVRSMTIRIPTNVHGKGDFMFTPELLQSFDRLGYAAYVDNGENHWNAVHKNDLASLFRLAAEKGKAGSVYHGSAEDKIKTKTIAEVMGKKLNIPVISITSDEAKKSLGFAGQVFCTNMESSADKTKKELGWVPQELGLFDAIEKYY